MRRLSSEYEKIRFLYLDKTRIANPSEWRGLTEDGFKVYVYFLAGELCIGIGDSFEEAKRKKVSVLEFADDETDFLSTDELMRLMRWQRGVVVPKYSLAKGLE